MVYGAISAWNLIIARTYFQTSPDSLPNRPGWTGAGRHWYLRKLSCPVCADLAVLIILCGRTLECRFNAMLYLSDSTLHPLQLFSGRYFTNSPDFLQGMEDARAGGLCHSAEICQHSGGSPSYYMHLSFRTEVLCERCHAGSY